MIVVVAGQGRNVGKTQAVCDLIAATPGAGWVAVKVSGHSHHPHDGPNKGTARYLAAGAVAAFLLQGPPPVDLPAAANLIIESNSILDQLTPDLLFLVVDKGTPDWKDSALRLKERPDVVEIEGRVTPEHIAVLRQRLTSPPS